MTCISFLEETTKAHKSDAHCKIDMQSSLNPLVLAAAKNSKNIWGKVVVVHLFAVKYILQKLHMILFQGT